MRWQAVVVEPSVLQRVLVALEKVGKKAAVHVSSVEMRLIMTHDLGCTESEEVFARFPVNTDGSIFRDYRAESRRNNNIFFTVELQNFLQAIKAAEGQSEFSIKLTRKMNQPYLSLDVATQSMNIVQDTPITMAQNPMQMMEQCEEPALTEPRVKIRMPSLRTLKNVVDRMRFISDTITLEATNAGTLVVRARDDLADIKTTFQGLALPTVAAAAAAAASSTSTSSSSAAAVDEEVAEATVKVRKFLAILQSRHLEPTSLIGCFVKDVCFVLHNKVQQGAATVTYYLPVIVSEIS